MDINELSPSEVFSYFQEICAIPHGSGNTGMIADYCLEFAKLHGLKARKDAADNVVIFKAGSSGYEDCEPVILQGHLDMVCEKEPDCDIDMSVQSIKACTDGKMVWADGTTLGADDGIAVAFILAVLASDTIAHPPIQAVLTSDEEIGMLGARDLDTSELTAKRLINIDSESEGILYVSCAGGVRAECDIPVVYEDAVGWVSGGEQDDNASDAAGNGQVCFEVKISGLAGGHSGVEIHKQHTNAIRLLASLLSHASCTADFRLVSLSGGGKENAIPKEAKAVVSVRSCDATTFEQSIKESADVWMQEISATEPHAKIEVGKADAAADKVLNFHSTENVIYALGLSPDGVYKMSQEIKGMVQTSLNLGTAYLDTDKLVYKYLIRSNTAAGKKLLLERVNTFVKHLSGNVVTMSDYPAWEYKSDSQLRKICVDSFTNVYGHEPEVTSIHAGLECGILAGKMPGVDMISFGPTLESVHTPDECMDAASVERTWEYLMEILKSL
jgi:dipeptidase D